ncbi:MAG: hypothetical protein GY913_04305 [Proteobacteria bacterium]|nr:hypothetical protein [Pseudomonadota bacterium]
MTRSPRRGLALAGLLLGSSVLVSGCGPSCECDPEVASLPDEGTWAIADIRVEDHEDGGGGESFEWNGLSPWGDVLEGEVRMVQGQLSVEYTTEQGTFLVVLEEGDSEGF